MIWGSILGVFLEPRGVLLGEIRVPFSESCFGGRRGVVRGPILTGFWEPFGTPGIHFEWILGAIWEPFANNSGHSRAKR